MSSPVGFQDLESPAPTGNSQDDQRALQIALELSNLGLLGTGDDDSSTSSYDEITKSKKSQNMTECVPVPSSEHVAEIVGRQGCKIKALRAKTSTYIKTPVRGEEPVFVVTGRKEDVAMARREIQSAAEHFTQIRATRNKSGVVGSTVVQNLPPAGNTSPTDLTSPGTITLQVRVPYRVVGLVVGPKGATIKRIQQQTHTYIVTPSRDKEPVFEVTGLPENVEKAKEEIEAHIAARTGSQHRDVDDDFASNGTLVGSPANCLAAQDKTTSAFTPYRASASLNQPRPGMADAFGYGLQRMDSNPFFHCPMNVYASKYQENANQHNPLLNMANRGMGMYARNQLDAKLDTFTSNSLEYENQAIPATSTWSNVDFNNPVSSLPFQLLSATADSSLNRTTGSTISPPTSMNGSAQHPRLSPALSDPEFPINSFLSPSNLQSSLSNLSRNPIQRVGSDSVDSTGSSIHSLDLATIATGLHKSTSNGINIESGYSSGGTTDSQTSGSPVETLSYNTLGNLRTVSPPRVCVMCNEGSVMAALVPCGHNLFCYECAQKAAASSAHCPCCNQIATMALLIKTGPA